MAHTAPIRIQQGRMLAEAGKGKELRAPRALKERKE
jgi:hypothetical protein